MSNVLFAQYRQKGDVAFPRGASGVLFDASIMHWNNGNYAASAVCTNAACHIDGVHPQYATTHEGEVIPRKRCDVG